MRQYVRVWASAHTFTFSRIFLCSLSAYLCLYQRKIPSFLQINLHMSKIFRIFARTL